MQLHSPDELLQEGKKLMLDGRDPTSRKDWMLIFNFLAANIVSEVQPAALLVFKLIYDVPLEDSEIEDISAFQLARKS